MIRAAAGALGLRGAAGATVTHSAEHTRFGHARLSKPALALVRAGASALAALAAQAPPCAAWPHQRNGARRVRGRQLLHAQKAV
jgi:hypothetical protein